MRRAPYAVAAALLAVAAVAAEPIPTTTLLGTPVSLPCTALPERFPRCGSQFGARCPAGRCCSVWGWCSELDVQAAGALDPAYCGAGCQAGFGLCVAAGAPAAQCPEPEPLPPIPNDFPVTTVSAGTPIYMPCPTLPISGNARCGPDFGTRCDRLECCSSYGWCGPDMPGEPYCGTGCKVGYGKCLIGDGPVSTGISCVVNPTATVSPPPPPPARPTTTEPEPTMTLGPTTVPPPPPPPRTTTQAPPPPPPPTTQAPPTLITRTQNILASTTRGATSTPVTSTSHTTLTSSTHTTTRTVPFFSATVSITTVTVYPACPGFPVSNDSRCGVETGFRCPDGLCCSGRGICQDDGGNSGWDWCAYPPCQIGYGKCFDRASPTSPPSDPPRFECPPAPIPSGSVLPPIPSGSALPASTLSGSAQSGAATNTPPPFFTPLTLTTPSLFPTLEPSLLTTVSGAQPSRKTTNTPPTTVFRTPLATTLPSGSPSAGGFTPSIEVLPPETAGPGPSPAATSR
ncbi:hypothetical protein DFJ74DRAFT_195400 [Hyaloraphidium curvatum]|nr:hypothetical protein DFJ74DRAFT_195400 [Hyaloraphidium curvatum]